MTVYFTQEHEWISLDEDGDVGVVGITRFAADKLGDIVFVDLPEAGRSVAAGKDMAVVESVKAASDVYAPVSGEVVEANPKLGAAPETVNADPEGEGWFVKLRVADRSELVKLMDKAAYDAFCASQ